MKRTSIIIGAVIALSLTACQKELRELQDAEAYNYAVTATRESDPETRATLTDNTTLTWLANESIGMYTTANKFEKMTTSKGGATATFTALMPEATSATKYAVYPYDEDNLPTVTNEKLTVKLPATRAWEDGKVDPPMLATFAENDPTTLTFKHLGGLVKITLNNVPAKYKSFSFTADKAIVGSFEVAEVNSENQISSTESSNDNNTVTFTFTNTATTNMDFYIPVPVGTYDFSIKLTSDDGSVEKSGKVTVERGKYHPLAAVKVSDVEAGSDDTTAEAYVSSSASGKVTLPACGGTVNVTMEENANAVELTYADASSVYPGTVNILCKGNIANSLTVTLPQSHVVIKKAAEATGNITIKALSSKTSNSTLVLDKTINEVTTLTVAGGSAEIASPKVTTVTVENTVDDAATVKVTDAEAKVTNLNVSKGNVEIEKGTVDNVTVASTVAETATVKVAKDATVSTKLEVAKAKSVEVAGSVKAVSVAADVAETKIASTAKDVETVEVKGGSVEVEAAVKTVKVETAVSNVTIAAAVETVTVADATESTAEGQTAAPVIWVTETGKVTTEVKDATANQVASVVAVNGQASEAVGDGQVKVVNNASGNAKTDAVKKPDEYLVAGGEVTLGQDMTGNFTIEKDVTIDLNGHKITNKDAQATFTVALGGKLTIKGEGTVDNTASRYPAIHNNGTLVLDGGTYTRSAEGNGNSYYTILNHGEMTVNSGVKVENSGTFSSTIGSGYDTWTPEGGKYTSYTDGTNHQYPSLTINGGSITGGKYSVKHNGTDNTLTIAAGVEIAKAKINGTILVYVASNDALTTALNDASIAKIVFTSDLKSSSIIKPSRELVIDLGGHKLTAGNTVKTSGAKYETTYTAVVTDGVKVTVKNGTIGDDDTKSGYGVYSTNNESSETVLDGITFGKSVIYAYNGGGKLDATGCKFYGWLSGWHKGGKFTNCEFGVGKAYYPAAICYGSTAFSGCTFFKNGVDADEYGAAGKKDSDGYYRCNYVVSACLPAETISFTNCKYSNNNSVTVSDHPYHFKDCINGWGDGKAVSGKVTVDNAEVTSTCSDAVLVSNAEMLAKALASTYVKKITLGADININQENNGIEVPVGREVTLDLNGKTLTSGERATANFRVYGVLTICDNSTEKSGKIVCEDDYTSKDYGYGLIRATGENAKIIVKSGEINAVRTTPASNGNFAVALMQGGDFEMTGGKIEAGWYAVAGNGDDKTYNSEIKISGGELISAADYAIYLPHKGVTTITGGKINGACGAVAIRRGTLNISGGEILSKNDGSTGNWTDGTGTLGNAALVVAANYGDCVVDISGGTFSAVKNAAVLDKPAGSYKAQIRVTGGTFSDNTFESYVQTGYKATESTESGSTVWKVEEDTTGTGDTTGDDATDTTD